MNRPLKTFLMLNSAGSTLRSRTAAPIVQLHYAMMLFLFLVTSGLSPHASAAQANSNKDARPAVTKFKICVPGAIVGDNYWIYLNGSLVSSPPHVQTHNKDVDFMTHKMGAGGGWQISGRDGLLLLMQHELFESSTSDGLALFDAFQVQLDPGEYTIEVAILLPGPVYRGKSRSSFPFVITQKHVVDVPRVDRIGLYVAVPDDWIYTPPPYPARSSLCYGNRPMPPESSNVQSMREYMDDPIVKALQYVADESPQGVAVLHLPQAQGGEREFDGKQIRFIADEIANRYWHADHKEVEECRSRFPEFAAAYTEFDELITVVDNDIARFRKLAASLERSQ